METANARRLKAAWWTKRRLTVVLWAALLVIPLLIGLTWGDALDDSAYVTLEHARSLAAGGGLTYDPLAGEQTLLQSPLYVLALWLPARLGVPLPQAGVALSALGWGVTAVALYSFGQAINRPLAAVVAAALVVFSPVVVPTLGMEISWVVALAWVAMASTAKRQWTVQACALAALLYVGFDLSALALAALLLIVQWVERKRFPLGLSLALAVALLGWALMAAWRIVPPLPEFRLNLAEWERGIRRLLDESSLYWLSLLPMGFGLLAVARKALWAGVLWVAAVVLSGDAVAGATLATLGLFLVGLGADWIIKWIEAHYVPRLDRLTLAVVVALVAGLPLGIAQLSSLVQRYQLKPVVRLELERQAADWLRAHSEPTAMVLSSQRVGFLADRAALAWDGGMSQPAELARLMRALTENPPAYGVSFRSIAWDRMVRTGWFEDRYEPVQSFASPYDSASPFTVWSYRSSVFDRGERQPLSVRLPDSGGLVGYRYWPNRIQPGDAVYVSLFFESAQSLDGSFRTLVQVLSPQDGVAWAQQGAVAQRSVLVDWWQTEQIVVDRFALTATGDIPIGAYHLDVTMMTPDWQAPVPMYQGDDTLPIDRITLGYVVVPWQGSLDNAEPVGANLGNQIVLLGFEVAGSFSPGGGFDVTLYWEARRPPEDDYVAFVHLLDENGQVVASHDGPPVDGRYTTRAWLPGDVVPDVHHVVLDPDIPPATYRLQAGLYQWPSLERLPVWDRQGIEQPDRVVILQTVELW
jgi:hypothetical protein